LDPQRRYRTPGDDEGYGRVANARYGALVWTDREKNGRNERPGGLRRLALELGAFFATEDHTRTALPPPDGIITTCAVGGEAATTAESILGTDSVGT